MQTKTIDPKLQINFPKHRQHKGLFSITWQKLVVWFLLVLLTVFTLTPIIYMITASFMPARDIMKMPYRWIPKTLHFDNFVQAVVGNDGSYIFLRNIFNSLVVAIVCAVTTVLMSALTGYGLAKFKFRGRNLLFMLIMATMMIPFEAIMIPLYMVITKLGIQNSYTGLILPFLVSAFGIFMMRQYLITFPIEFLDAARVDGMTEPGIFLRIVFPNCKPAIATLAILAFRAQWDNLLWPLLISQSENMKTIPLYIVKFTTEMNTDEGAMMAVAAIASIPMFILFFALSNYFLGGASVYSSRKG